MADQGSQSRTQNITSPQRSFLHLPAPTTSVYLWPTLTELPLSPIHPHHLGDSLKETIFVFILRPGIEVG